jgi:REP element-mobilizing transposase RayT
MPRPLRLEAEDAVYHVIARGNERKAVFRDDRDRQAYLDRLIRCRERFGLRLLAFCFMGNHLHLAVERGPVKLSRVMLTVQSGYTQWFNRRHGRVGHLFQGRYKAFLVEKDRYLLALLRYIHRNPLKAGLVERAEQFAWSSDRYYRRGKGPEWLDLDRVLPMLGPTHGLAVSRYRRLMAEEEGESYESLPGYARAIKGEKAFAQRILREAGETPIPISTLTEATVATIVARTLGVRVEQMKSARRNREVSRARIVAAYLGREVGALPVSRMARYFGREESTLVRGVLSLEEKLEHDAALRRQLLRMGEVVGAYNT